MRRGWRQPRRVRRRRCRQQGMEQGRTGQRRAAGRTRSSGAASAARRLSSRSIVLHMRKGAGRTISWPSRQKALQANRGACGAAVSGGVGPAAVQRRAGLLVRQLLPTSGLPNATRRAWGGPPEPASGCRIACGAAARRPHAPSAVAVGARHLPPAGRRRSEARRPRRSPPAQCPRRPGGEQRPARTGRGRSGTRMAGPWRAPPTSSDPRSLACCSRTRSQRPCSGGPPPPPLEAAALPLLGGPREPS